MREYDLLILGSGSGNSIPDDRFADWRTAFVDHGTGPRRSYGGTCLNVGCIPTKMFVHSADLARSPAEAARLGIGLDLRRPVDWPAVRDRIFGRIDAIADSGEEYRAHGSPNTEVLTGTARFTGPRQVAVRDRDTGEDETVTARRIVVATGSRPAVPEIPGLADSGYHTSDSVMRLEHLPASLAILGSGFIAAELAHVFASLGTRVTVIARSDRLLRHEDDALSLRFTEQAVARWDVRLNRTTERVHRDGDTVRLHLTGPAGNETVEAETLLVATGRTPNADLLDAPAAGIALTPDGRIAVDATQATSAAGVWALGDVSSPYQLKHVANREARTVQYNLLHPDAPIETDHRVVPHAVFSDPRIASVGLTEREARERGIPCVTSVQEYAGIAYGWAMEDTSGFAKLLADPGTGQLLGAHIIGPEAPTLIQPLVQAMQFGLDARRMAREQYWIHPAMPELVENALLGLPLPDAGGA